MNETLHSIMNGTKRVVETQKKKLLCLHKLTRLSYGSLLIISFASQILQIMLCVDHERRQFRGIRIEIEMIVAHFTCVFISKTVFSFGFARSNTMTTNVLSEPYQSHIRSGIETLAKQLHIR